MSDVSKEAATSLAPETIQVLRYACYQDQWTGFAPGFLDSGFHHDTGRHIYWDGHLGGILFDRQEVGVPKELYIETSILLSIDLRRQTAEEAMFARLLGVEPGIFDEPAKVDPAVLTETERFLLEDNPEEPLYTFGEAFGHTPTIAVAVDRAFARKIYQVAAIHQSTNDTFPTPLPDFSY